MSTSTTKTVRHTLEDSAIGTILHKIDKIEEGQGETIRRLENLHTAIYEPDEGLFARIKAGSNASEQRAVAIDQKYTLLANQLMLTKEHATGDVEKFKKLDDSSVKVDELMKWKKNINSVFLWILITTATGSAGMIAKFLYEWFQGHVQVI